MIVQKLVISYPNKFRACILLGTTSRFGSSNQNWKKNFINSRINPFKDGKTMKDISLHSVTKIMSNKTNKRKIYLAASIMNKIKVNAYITAIKSLINFDESKNLHKISIPTLLIAGDQDTLAPSQTMKKMHNMISNSEFIILKDCGHLINIEKSEEISKIIIDFIKRNYLFTKKSNYEKHKFYLC